MPYPARAVVRALSLLALIFTVACAEPPSKEMNQAQGAIDAARAAGADQYAGDELKAAIDALAHADLAVKDGDYRLALNHALDSRERAQNAARMVVDARAQARGTAERAIGEVAALITRARTRLSDPEIARLPPRIKGAPTVAIDSAEQAVQEARAALAKNDYETVNTSLKGRAATIEAALKELDAAVGGDGTRRRR